MPIITTKQWDPTGELAATPDDNSSGKNVLELIGGVMKVMKKRQQEKVEKALREKVLAGGEGVGFEYDPETGKAKYKMDGSKPDSLASKIQRYIVGQQFGVDPVTQQPIQDPKKPRFGYQGNNIWGQLLQEDPDLSGTDDGSAQPPAASAPAAPPPVRRGNPFVPSAQASTVVPGGPRIDNPVGVDGAQPEFLDELELAAQNAILKGADVAKVKARLAQLKAAQAAQAAQGANGTV